MKRILLLSDTHGYLDDRIRSHAMMADELWHAGDIGNIDLSDELKKIKPFRAVYGNIDDHQIRSEFPEHVLFDCEGLTVLMIHIAGTPPKYNPQVKQLLHTNKPELLICGHSHILKVIRDKENNLLFMNPGAAGVHGFHRMRTMLRFIITSGKIDNVEVIELGLRGKLTEPVGGTN